MSTLHLNVSLADFDDIAYGRLKFVQHSTGMLWSRIMQQRPFDRILVKCCYPASSFPRVLARKWTGYEIQTIESNGGPVEVFAIRVGVAL